MEQNSDNMQLLWCSTGLNVKELQVVLPPTLPHPATSRPSRFGPPRRQMEAPTSVGPGCYKPRCDGAMTWTAIAGLTPFLLALLFLQCPGPFRVVRCHLGQRRRWDVHRRARHRQRANSMSGALGSHRRAGGCGGG